jgi:quercetin dioxygenase-like cupin family protein
MRKWTLLSASAALLAVGVWNVGTTPAQDSAKPSADMHRIVKPSEMKWEKGPPSLPEKLQVAVLRGNPQTGAFAMMLKMPANYRIPAHWHSYNEDVTVISGSFQVGTGDLLDESKATELKPGGFVHLPPKMHHFAFTNQETVVQLDSEGPFDIHYINPTDDPQK